ncbi:MAG: hypothetical protein ACPGMW_03825 [Poseidonia sp.]
MKTTTFERALANNHNVVPLRGESLGMSIKSNPHCHCYADLKGTVKRNPHCPTHGSNLSGSAFYKTGTGLAVASAVGLMIYDRRKFGDWRYAQDWTKYALGGFAGWFLGGLANWEALP